MKHMVKFTALACCYLAATSLFAEITTGWIQTGAGPYDYNDVANWVNGDINGVFSSDLELTAAQTITFSQDTTLPNGLTFNHAGAYKITMKSANANTYTLTLGGDIVNSSKGSVEPEATLAFNLGEETRTIACNGAAILIHGVISNGGIKFTGTSDLRLYGANTFEGGLDVFSTGYLYPRSVNSLGNGTVTFEGNNKVNGESSITLANNPIVLKGDIYYTGDKSLNMGAGAVTVTQPLTITVNKNTFTLGGPVAVDSPAKITDVTKAGGGSLSTSAGVEIDGTDVIRTTSGTWYFNGAVSGTGPLIVRGTVEMKGSCSFDGDVRVESGSLRLCAKNVLPASAKVYIAKGATFRNYQSNGYGIATMINGGRIDPSSEGTFGIAENEENQNIDLSNYPKLVLAPNGDNRTLNGTITAPSTGTLRIGGGGKTLKIGGTITGASEIDASTGSIQLNASQPDFDGTVICGPGYTLTVGSSVELANADLVSDGGTIKFASADAGDFTRARSVTLKSATLTVDTPSSGAVGHIITGALTVDCAEAGGCCVLSCTGSADYTSTLQVGSVVQNRPNFLHMAVDGLGETVKVKSNSSVPLLSSSGTFGTVTTPVVPWVRTAYGAMVTYDQTNGFRGLSEGEHTKYATSTDPVAVPTQVENMYFYGATDVTFSDGAATVNSISAIGASSKLAAKMTATGDFTVLSGAIGVYSDTGSKIECGSIDFGDERGYIWGQTSSTKDASGTVKAAIKGNKGLTIGNGGMTPQSSAFFFNGTDSTYTGDVYIVGRVTVQGTGALPKGEERPGNIYLPGTLALTGTVNINGLNGSGTVTTHNSNGGTLNLGYDGSDGDFSGTFVNNKGANVYFNKYGSGTQRMAGPMAFKYNCIVYGGTLQIDGNLTVARDGNNVIVKDGGTLSGCGTITGYAYEIIENGGTLAPGSAQKPNVPMTLRKELRMQDGASMKFYIGADRASQAIVAEGYGITGTAETIPVTVDCTVKKKGSWLLLEADTFNDKAFVFTTRPSGGRLVVKTDEATNRAQLWFEQTTGFSVTLR